MPSRVTVSAALIALAVGAVPAGGASRPDAEVTLKRIAFTPSTVRVRPGERVVWSWHDRYASHNIHSRGEPRFRGATARRTGSHAVRFTRRGVYRYACTLHPGMTGRVVVK